MTEPVIEPQASEWRRGGDPANPPIDRVGVWEKRCQNAHVSFGFYKVHDLEDASRPLFQPTHGEEWETSSNTVGVIQRHPSFEWRFVGPLPSEAGDPAPGGGGKGDLETGHPDDNLPDLLDCCGIESEFNRSYRKWLSEQSKDEGERGWFNDKQTDFLESPAGRAAVLKLWGEEDAIQRLQAERDVLVIQLAECKKNRTDLLHSATDFQMGIRKIGEALGLTDETSEQLCVAAAHRLASQLTEARAERDALREKVAELEKEAERAHWDRYSNRYQQAKAWEEIYMLCLRHGMTQTIATGLHCVTQFLESRLSASPSEAGGNPRPPEDERAEELRTLRAMIEDLQQRMECVESLPIWGSRQ